MKRIESLAVAGLTATLFSAGIAGAAVADEPNYPPTTPTPTVTSTTQVVGGVETEQLAQTGGSNSGVLLASAVGLVVVGGVTVTYARRRKHPHEA